MIPLKVSILFFLLFFSSFTTYSQTYYVDYLNGDDLNDGLTVNTPFKHCPGDPSASSNAALTSLIPGTTVLFKSDIEYLGQVLIPTSGTSSNEIVFKGDEWGLGKATFNLQNIREYAFKGNNKQYIRIEGFNIYNYMISGSDYPIFPTNGSAYWIINNCVIALVKDWDNIEIFPDKAAIYLGSGIANITIKNSEFFANGRTTIKSRGSKYTRILNNDFGGINRGDSTGWFSVAIREETSGSDFIVSGNTFHDGWQYGGDQNPELKHAPDYIHTYGSSSTVYPNNWIVERNFFGDNKYYDYGTGTGFMSISSFCKNFYIRNNIFTNSAQWWGGLVLVSSGADSIFIDNNTFIVRKYALDESSDVYGLVIYSGGTIPAGDSIYVRNNIFYSDGVEIGSGIRDYGLVCFKKGGSKGVWDYNAFYVPDSNYTVLFEDGTGFKPLSYWQNNSGQNANSIFLSSPRIFVDFPESPINSLDGDYSLTSDASTFLRSGGNDLSTYFKDDYEGTIRDDWSVGAYEYSGGGVITDTTPPSLLSASVITPTTIELTFSEALESSSALNKIKLFYK